MPWPEEILDMEKQTHSPIQCNDAALHIVFKELAPADYSRAETPAGVKLCLFGVRSARG